MACIKSMSMRRATCTSRKFRTIDRRCSGPSRTPTRTGSSVRWRWSIQSRHEVRHDDETTRIPGSRSGAESVTRCGGTSAAGCDGRAARSSGSVREDDEAVQIAGPVSNALAAMTDAPGGLWIGQQKVTASSAKTYNVPLDSDPDEAAWLVDWNGKLLKTVITHSRNTSGMAYGDGCIWMGANAEPFGIFQLDMNGRQLSHRQIPLSPDGRGGGTHGVKWH